jgi:hypothetical protein
MKLAHTGIRENSTNKTSKTEHVHCYNTVRTLKLPAAPAVACMNRIVRPAYALEDCQLGRNMYCIFTVKGRGVTTNGKCLLKKARGLIARK